MPSNMMSIKEDDDLKNGNVNPIFKREVLDTIHDIVGLFIPESDFSQNLELDNFNWVNQNGKATSQTSFKTQVFDATQGMVGHHIPQSKYCIDQKPDLDQFDEDIQSGKVNRILKRELPVVIRERVGNYVADSNLGDLHESITELDIYPVGNRISPVCSCKNILKKDVLSVIRDTVEEYIPDPLKSNHADYVIDQKVKLDKIHVNRNIAKVKGNFKKEVFEDIHETVGEYTSESSRKEDAESEAETMHVEIADRDSEIEPKYLPTISEIERKSSQKVDRKTKGWMFRRFIGRRSSKAKSLTPQVVKLTSLVELEGLQGDTLVKTNIPKSLRHRFVQSMDGLSKQVINMFTRCIAGVED